VWLGSSVGQEVFPFFLKPSAILKFGLVSGQVPGSPEPCAHSLI
jgi:hypothetical protein